MGFQGMARLYNRAFRGLLSLLVGSILLCFFAGIIKTLLDFRLLLSHSLESAFHSLLIDFLLLLAAVEIHKTTVTYLARGRVKVTYIIDTVLIVMLSEVITLWFKGAPPIQCMMLALILFTLVIVRVITIRLSPASEVLRRRQFRRLHVNEAW